MKTAHVYLELTCGLLRAFAWQVLKWFAFSAAAIYSILTPLLLLAAVSRYRNLLDRPKWRMLLSFMTAGVRVPCPSPWYSH